MTFLGPARVGLILALAGLAVGLATADVAARPKPVPVIVPPPPPPPMPDVAMGQRLIGDAAAFEDYMRKSALISPAFSDGAGVRQAWRAGAAYQPAQFGRGEVAYAALAALQDPTFVEAVRAAGQTPEQRYDVVRGIFAAPSYALAFKDAAGAAGLAKEALTGEGMRLFDAGKAVSLAAYSIQHQPWSLQDVPAREARLAAVKTLSASPRLADPDVTLTMQRAASGQPALGLAADPARPPYTPLIVRAVALAALAAIGQAGDDQAVNISWLTDDYFTDHCLSHAKNELNVCLSVAKPNYEDVFCLGQHAMNTTGACVVQGAGGAVPLEVINTPLLNIPPYHHRPAAHAHRRRK
jgi:hypothetical protein